MHDQSFFVSAAPLQYDRLPALVAHLQLYPESEQHTAADVVAKAQAILSEPELLTVGLCMPHYLGLFPTPRHS